jgi:cytochrome c-type biogenesis protein CcmH/NrfF
MKYRSRYLLLFALVIMTLITACASGSPKSTPAATTSQDGATLLQERCSVCHPSSFVTRRAYTEAQWKIIVDNMVQRGAQLTSDEQSVLVAYLAKNYGK